MDIGTTEIEFKLLEFGGGSIPDGTVTNSTLRWDGTDWVENESVQSIDESDYWGLYITDNEDLNEYIALDFSRDSENTYSSIVLGATQPYLHLYKNDNEALDGNVFILCSRIAESFQKTFQVDYDGKITSNVLTANTVLLANASKEIVSLTSGTAGQVLMQKAASVVWETLSIPENRASYLITQDLFPNLFVTTDPAPLPPPITTFRKVGDITDTGVTDFKVTLKANKRYSVKLRLYLDVNNTLGGFDCFFDLKVNTPATWSSSLYLAPQTRFEIQSRPDITTYDFGATSALPVALNTNVSLFYENDTGALVRNIPFLDIEGIVITDTADELSISLRNSVLALPDGDTTMVVKENSFITAVETTAN